MVFLYKIQLFFQFIVQKYINLFLKLLNTLLKKLIGHQNSYFVENQMFIMFLSLIGFITFYNHVFAILRTDIIKFIFNINKYFF